MTNYEFYKDELINLLAFGYKFAIKQGKLVDCGKTRCCDCEFSNAFTCNDARGKWLNAEYVEQHKLTLGEWYYCKALRPESVISRNMYGDIIITSDGYYATPNLTVFNNVNFPFIKVEKKWKVEDILKLEVIEDA